MLIFFTINIFSIWKKQYFGTEISEKTFEEGQLIQPNNPGCANFASILRTVLFGVISTQNYYVSTLCVNSVLTIRFANFA